MKLTYLLLYLKMIVKLKTFTNNIEIPDDSDAVYLGISSWGRMNSHSGPCVQSEDIGLGMVRIYNMLSAHSVLYLDEEYISLCSKIAHQSFETAQHQDIGFAEIQRYYNVYAFDNPLFYQTSSNGTDQPLTSYGSFEVIQPKQISGNQLFYINDYLNRYWWCWLYWVTHS